LFTSFAHLSAKFGRRWAHQTLNVKWIFLIRTVLSISFVHLEAKLPSWSAHQTPYFKWIFLNTVSFASFAHLKAKLVS
jgi:hypothetical protein